MLKIHAFNSYSRTKIFPCCPECGKGIEVTLPAFIMAINLEQKYHCPDCKNTFMVKVELLDPRSPTLRAADTQATTEALIEEIIDAAFGMLNEKPVNVSNFRRFLRERLGRS